MCHFVDALLFHLRIGNTRTMQHTTHTRTMQHTTYRFHQHKRPTNSRVAPLNLSFPCTFLPQPAEDGRPLASIFIPSKLGFSHSNINRYRNVHLNGWFIFIKHSSTNTFAANVEYISPRIQNLLKTSVLKNIWFVLSCLFKLQNFPG